MITTEQKVFSKLVRITIIFNIKFVKGNVIVKIKLIHQLQKNIIKKIKESHKLTDALQSKLN